MELGGKKINVSRGFSKTLGFLKDYTRSTIAKTVERDELKTSVFKACNHFKNPPKEKHVRKLIHIAKGSGKYNYQMINELETVLKGATSWIVALKTMIVFHRIIQDSSNTFCDSLVQSHPGKVLNMVSFQDNGTPNAIDQSNFIKQYARYVEERVSLYRKLGVRQLTTQINTKNMIEGETQKEKNKSLFKITKAFQELTDELLQCRMKGSMLINTVTLRSFSLLLQDSFSIFKALSDIMLVLIDYFFKMDKDTAKYSLQLYKKHIHQTTYLIKLYNFARNSPQINGNRIPNLKLQPKEMIDTMEKYINGMDKKKGQQNEDENQDRGEEEEEEEGNGEYQNQNEDEEIKTKNLKEILSENELNQIQQNTTPGGQQEGDIFGMLENNSQIKFDEESDDDDDDNIFSGKNTNQQQSTPENKQQNDEKEKRLEELFGEVDENQKANQEFDELFGSNSNQQNQQNQQQNNQNININQQQNNQNTSPSLIQFNQNQNPNQNQTNFQSNIPNFGNSMVNQSYMPQQIGNYGIQQSVFNPQAYGQGMYQSQLQMKQQQIQQQMMLQQQLEQQRKQEEFQKKQQMIRQNQFQQFQENQRKQYETEVKSQIQNNDQKKKNNNDPFSDLL